MLLEYEWDEAKNQSNQKKHGFSFEEAIRVFDDPLHVSILERVQDGEERWQTFGVVKGSLLLMVAHTVQDEDGLVTVVRVISARRAGRKERGYMKTKMVRYTFDTLPPLTEAQEKNLNALAELPDESIDFSDIPEVTEEQMKRAIRGRFYRSHENEIVARLDADVLSWLKEQGSDYQANLNAILRREMLAQRHG